MNFFRNRWLLSSMDYQTRTEPSDAELAFAARGGDVACLGVLLERHRARLHAAALRVLGYGVEAEDAVQETFLVALRHIGSLNEPQAVVGWLLTILHRCCLRHLRRRRGEVLAAEVPDRPDEAIGPEERVEKLAMRDWVWDALHRLPEPLRATAMLRYFGSYQSYEELASILSIPVGTVRSRLATSRRKLAGMLLETAGLHDGDSRLSARRHAQYYETACPGLLNPSDRDRYFRHFAPDLELYRGGQAPVIGRCFFLQELTATADAGVMLHTQRVLSAGNVTVVEGRFVNPDNDPLHCPPGVAFVIFRQGGLAVRLHIHLSSRPPATPEDEP